MIIKTASVGVVLTLTVASILGCSQITANQPAQPKPVQNSSKALRDAMQMILIPEGSFVMGLSGKGEDKDNVYVEELPPHDVQLSGYEIGKYEVTRGEYREFIKDNGYNNKQFWSDAGWKWKTKNKIALPKHWSPKQNWRDFVEESDPKFKPLFTQTDNYPVVGISYYEAEAFCKWAGGRLPTEAEWEKAARWDSKEKQPYVFPWGDTWDVEKCNNLSDRNKAGGGYKSYQTAPVGSYPGGVSSYGCYDMAGNVAEWCQDWFEEEYYTKAPAGGWVNPSGPVTGDERVRRGATAFGNFSSMFRCSARSSGEPGHRSHYTGFRLARDIKR